MLPKRGAQLQAVSATLRFGVTEPTETCTRGCRTETNKVLGTRKVCARLTAPSLSLRGILAGQVWGKRRDKGLPIGERNSRPIRFSCLLCSLSCYTTGPKDTGRL